MFLGINFTVIILPTSEEITGVFFFFWCVIYKVLKMNFKLKTSELLLYHGNSHNLVIGRAGNTVVKGWALLIVEVISLQSYVQQLIQSHER